MEDFNKEKYPKCLKATLIAAGYDTLSSLSQLTEEKIKVIEEFHTQNNEFVAKFDCCHHEHYKELNPFVFLPGHKAIIMAIPNQIEQIKCVEKPKTKCVPTSLKPNLQSDEELKDKLIVNLMKYSGKAGYQFPDDVITEVNLHNFIRGSTDDNFVCKCQFSCPFCSKMFQLVYKSFWMSSNVTQHLKMHINTEQATDV